MSRLWTIAKRFGLAYQHDILSSSSAVFDRYFLTVIKLLNHAVAELFLVESVGVVNEIFKHSLDHHAAAASGKREIIARREIIRNVFCYHLTKISDEQKIVKIVVSCKIESRFQAQWMCVASNYGECYQWIDESEISKTTVICLS